MREQARINSLFFTFFFTIASGFQPPNTNRSASLKQTRWKCGNLRQSLLTFSVILKTDLSQKATKPLVRTTNNETGHTRTHNERNSVICAEGVAVVWE